MISLVGPPGGVCVGGYRNHRLLPYTRPVQPSELAAKDVPAIFDVKSSTLCES